MRKRSWTTEQLVLAVKSSKSIRQVLGKLGLKTAGGNYCQIHKFIKELELSTMHFTGMAWNKGLSGYQIKRMDLTKILVINSDFQSYKLKNRLFQAKLKEKRCEMCGWAKIATDGRIPLELDHINGNAKDNRLSNLRVLCPNCHSLQPTHRGKNKNKLVNYL
jgi:hypothetical protein